MFIFVPLPQLPPHPSHYHPPSCLHLLLYLFFATHPARPCTCPTDARTDWYFLFHLLDLILQRIIFILVSDGFFFHDLHFYPKKSNRSFDYSAVVKNFGQKHFLSFEVVVAHEYSSSVKSFLLLLFFRCHRKWILAGAIPQLTIRTGHCTHCLLAPFQAGVDRNACHSLSKMHFHFYCDPWQIFTWLLCRASAAWNNEHFWSKLAWNTRRLHQIPHLGFPSGKCSGKCLYIDLFTQ